MLDHDGYVLRQAFEPQVSTIELARQVGTIVDIQKILPSSKIPTVQTLRPRDTCTVRSNQYSGNYGLGRFPLHTDLAHWALPPRYFMLRCIAGSEDVYTNVVSCAPIINRLGRLALTKAVFRGRRRSLGCSSLVRALSFHEDDEIFRWDPIFLEPLTAHARDLSQVMHDYGNGDPTVNVRLAKPGDTIIVDNWRSLHGRAAVTSAAMTRQVERVYFSEVFNGS